MISYETSLSDDQAAMYGLMEEIAAMVYGEWDYNFPYNLWKISHDIKEIEMLDEYQRELLLSVLDYRDTLDQWCIGYRSYMNEPIFINTLTFEKMYDDWLNTTD